MTDIAEAARVEEREAIVRWLREQSEKGFAKADRYSTTNETHQHFSHFGGALSLDKAADAIERAAHLGPSS